jgi:protein-S-isoprenylcysteine O-methyltransferase Ste14
MWKRLLRWSIAMAVLSSGLVLLEGGYDRWLVAYCVGWGAFSLVTVLSVSDDLLRERFRPPDFGADKVWLRAIQLIALAHLVTGALDAGRWHIAPVADSIRGPAVIAMLASASLITFSMRTNRFFSSVVRIQQDRGHHVIDSGPYSVVRHPGYLGMLVAVPCSGLALGSWIAVALGLIYSALIIRRVRFEDAFLQSHLQGYRGYAGRVPYRLVPGAW